MKWLHTLIADPSSAQTSVLVLGLVIALGLTLGAVRVRSFRLGVAGVLFSGLLHAHLGLKVEPAVLEFAREAGLVLFVFSVGLTIGPGFFSSLRKQGLKANALAATIVLLGALLTLAISSWAHIPRPAAVGLFSGATTNTPSLAAATQALRENPPDESVAQRALLDSGTLLPAQAPTEAPRTAAEHAALITELAKLPGLAYAVTYPMGVLGVLITMALLRRVFRIDPEKEARELIIESREITPPREQINLRVTNPNLEGIELQRIPGLAPSGVTISRVEQQGKVFVPTGRTRLNVGDTLLAVGPVAQLEALRIVVGELSDRDLRHVESDITFRWLTVTRKNATGKNTRELGLGAKLGVRVTRIRRADVDMPPLDDVTLHPGDQLFAVGPAAGLDRAAAEVGDAPKRLEEPELVPIFVGIVLGIIVGSIPIAIPGLPAGVRLGLAGGPLVVAMILARIQRVGPLLWFLPRSASLILKDLGITLFLASVGLKSGDRIAELLTSGHGIAWLAWGALITIAPILLVGAFALGVLKMRYLTLCGILAGSMTDPPSLAFANAQADSEAPSIAYATVYPLAMILRVIAAQLMILWWVL